MCSKNVLHGGILTPAIELVDCLFDIDVWISMSTTLYWSQFCQFSDFDSLGSIHFRIVEINKRWVSLSFSFLLNLNMRQAATRGLQNCQCPCQLLIIIIIIASLYCDTKYPNGSIALSSGVKWPIITVIASHCCKNHHFPTVS